MVFANILAVKAQQEAGGLDLKMSQCRENIQNLQAEQNEKQADRHTDYALGVKAMTEPNRPNNPPIECMKGSYLGHSRWEPYDLRPVAACLAV